MDEGNRRYWHFTADILHLLVAGAWLGAVLASVDARAADFAGRFTLRSREQLAVPAAAADILAQQLEHAQIGQHQAADRGQDQAEAAEEAKKKAEAERVARARADNCERAKRGKGALDSGTRVAVVNAKGEREFLDDNRPD